LFLLFKEKKTNNKTTNKKIKPKNNQKITTRKRFSL